MVAWWTRTAATLAAAVAAFERRIGAERPGRSPWMWLLPVLTAGGTFAIVVWLTNTDGELNMWIRVPLGLFAALFMGTMSGACLMSFAEDEPED